MTRNRDDFSALQALRTGLIAVLAVVAMMAALGVLISDQKTAAKNRATTIAANALDFSTSTTEVSAATNEAARG